MRLDVDTYEWEPLIEKPLMVERWWNDEPLWLTADLHLGHKNVLEYEPCRKSVCANVAEMCTVLIKNWNTVVGKSHALNLGDLSLTNAEITRSLISGMTGNTRFLLGNHDRCRSLTWWKRIYQHVYDTPIIVDATPSTEQPALVIFSHQPVSLHYMDEYGADYNIHGHMHSKCLASKKHFCVSIEHTNWMPIELKQVITHLRG
jgi:calcineurin-like phosphoesterase family protein